VGADLTSISRHPGIDLVDGVDWFWGPSMVRATFLLIRQRPRYVVFQWWTGTVLHSYLALALLSKVIGARVIVEFHEIVETGEDRIAWARRYISTLSPILMRLADAFAVHSSFDRDLVRQRYPLRGRPLHVLPVGPLDHYREPDAAVTALREAPTGTINLLFFGIIRPYKGLEHLIAAFDLLAEDEVERYWLTVVGETWEGWTLPERAIAESRYRDRITFVNRYVHDRELDALPPVVAQRSAACGHGLRVTHHHDGRRRQCRSRPCLRGDPARGARRCAGHLRGHP
jgi:glycosyltransferase involved in cell wall biosynthesis